MNESPLDLRSKCRFVQFQLWRNCPHNCDFCYNKDLPLTDKAWSLNAIINKLQTPLIDKFNEIGFIGGEIFGKELTDDIKPLFYKMIDIVIEKITKGPVRKLYITTALMYKDRTSLKEFIEYIDKVNCLQYLLICTSYDTIYRFKNENAEKLWADNMEWLHKEFPNLNVHTETILTQAFIEKVNRGEFSITEFQRKYHTKMNFIAPQCNTNCRSKKEFDDNLPNFLPKRASFLKFLKIVHTEINMDELLNEALHSDLLYLECDGYLYEFLGRRRFPTLMDVYYRKIGRNFYHLGYVDSDIRIEDDVAAFRDMVSC